MLYAENNRISHRQLYLQMILTFTSPFLLCLFGKGRLNGIMGMAGCFLALPVLLFYVIFLIRLAPYFDNLLKFCGRGLTILTACFFLIYILFTAASLLSVVSRVIPESLLEGVPEIWILFFTILVCLQGSYRGVQRRGRMAEVSGRLLLIVIILMMLLCLGQAKAEYFMEVFAYQTIDLEAFWRNGYGVICAFAGLSLLPFLLGSVEKQGSSWKPSMSGILTIGAILELMLILLPAVFGWKRLKEEEFPILPLLAGADLPGKILARFDVLWMGFVAYGMLFSISSLFHYGHLILEQLFGDCFDTAETSLIRRRPQRGVWTERRMIIGQWRSFFLGLITFFLTQLTIGKEGIEEYYFPYLGAIFVPGVLLLQCLIFFRSKGRRKQKSTAVMLSLLLLFSGCAGREPEMRRYPLAMGIQKEGDFFCVSYGMPNLSESTGQGKAEEGNDGGVLILTGQTFSDLDLVYQKTQAKYLDTGHLQIILLGEELINSNEWETVFSYLKDQRMIGENIYLFQTRDPSAILSWQKTSETSVGEYLTEVLENTNKETRERSVTLRDAYYSWYQRGELPKLPVVEQKGEEIWIEVE